MFIDEHTPAVENLRFQWFASDNPQTKEPLGSSAYHVDDDKALCRQRSRE